MTAKVPDSGYGDNQKYGMPKILCLDVESSCVDELSKEYPVFNGSLNCKIDSNGRNAICLPENYIDYDALVLDVKNIKYILTDSSGSRNAIVDFLRLFEAEQQTKKLEIVFCDSQESLLYENAKSLWTYDFLSESGVVLNRSSEIHSVVSKDEWLRKYEKDFTSRVCFSFTSGKGGGIPLLVNRTGDITGFIWTNGKLVRVILPKIKYQIKAKLVLDIISNIGLTYCGEVFPEQVKQDWFGDSYYPSSVQRLIGKKQKEIVESKNRLAKIDEQITREKESLSFLRDLLVSDGDVLVVAVKKALHVIGIDKIVAADEEKLPGEDLEEDLRVDDYYGVRLVMEVKGIAAQIPTDEDCRQIGKIVFRYLRKSPGKDTHGILILNHQKLQPLESRVKNPFAGKKAEDAKDEGRGLMTTAFLYRLCCAVLDGKLDKSYLCKMLLNNGVIDSLASDGELAGEVAEYYSKTNACVVTCLSKTLHVGDKLLLNHDDDWCSAVVSSLMKDDKLADCIEEGEVAGIVFDTDFKPVKGTRLYFKGESV